MNDTFAEVADSQVLPTRRKRRWPVFLLGLVIGSGLGGYGAYGIFSPIHPPMAVPKESKPDPAVIDRARGMSILERVQVAAVNYTRTNDGLLPPVVFEDDEGTVQSWRVGLSQRFRGRDVNESPQWLQVPGSPAEGTAHSSFFVITGDETPFPQAGQVAVRDIAANDGLSATLIFVEATEMNIEWTSPQDIPFEALNAPPRELRGKGPSTHRSDAAPLVMFCDGRGQTLNPDMDPSVLRAIATWKGAEQVTRKDF